MSQHEIKVSESFCFTDQDMEDIMVTALEGGIGYWACLDNTLPEWDGQPSDTPTAVWAWKILSEGGTLHFQDAEDDEEKWELTLQKLYCGIAQTIQETYWDGDMDCIDAEVADSIIQYALFGELVYG